MMWGTKRLLLLASAIATGLLTFIGTTWATGEKPDFPSAAPVRVLPRAPLPADVRSFLERHLRPDVLSRFGISEESYNNARVLAQTEAGIVHAIPGSSGVCLSLQELIVCGDRNEPVAVLAPHEAYLAGAGYVPGPARAVTFKLRDGRTIAATLTAGGFVVGRAQNLVPGEKFDLAIDYR